MFGHALSLRSPDIRSERRNIEITKVLGLDAGNSFTIGTSNTVQTLAKFVKIHDPDFSCSCTGIEEPYETVVSRRFTIINLLVLQVMLAIVFHISKRMLLT
ncbi:hypothetical protein C8J55DRAFT_489638 [Lentinula edodes]|uniref:Uncharacterized protein n=1 Tax=Lentinula lateritia TaxID=40482 RepID=A0A9W9ACF4_9AGAR|nr:hypothetical protein C8J55DRAFT_489638 [Lentinula edodes]